MHVSKPLLLSLLLNNLGKVSVRQSASRPKTLFPVKRQFHNQHAHHRVCLYRPNKPQVTPAVSLYSQGNLGSELMIMSLVAQKQTVWLLVWYHQQAGTTAQLLQRQSSYCSRTGCQSR